MATDYSVVPEDASVAPQETGFWNNLGNKVESFGSTVADTASDLATSTTEFTKEAIDASSDAINNTIDYATGYIKPIASGATEFYQSVTSDAPDADITKVSAENKDLMSQIKNDQEDSAMTNAVESIWNFATKDVPNMYNNFFDTVDKKYFEDAEKAQSAIKMMNDFEKLNADPSNPKYQENMNTMVKDLRGYMKNGYLLSDQEVLDNYNTYSKEKNSATNTEGDEEVNAIIQKKVQSLVKEEVPGAEFNMQQKSNFVDRFKEELTQVVTQQADLARQAARGGIDQETFEKEIAKYDEILAIKTRLGNELIKKIATDPNAVNKNVGDHGALYAEYSKLATLEEAQKLIEYERGYSSDTNLLVASAQIKAGNPAMKLLGAFNAAVTAGGLVLNVKEIVSPLTGRTYNMNDKDSIMDALASDENYISLANLSGIGYAFQSSLNNIDDIANVAIGAGKFNAVSRVNKVTNFLDKASKNKLISTIATYGKGIIEGAAANQLMAISANQVATDEYILTNMLLDGPMENLIGSMGSGVGKLTGYTSLGETRKFSKKYIEDLNIELAATTDQTRKESLQRQIDSYKDISAEEQRASLAGLKELAKANMDFTKRTSILQDTNTLVTFAKGVVDEFEKSGGSYTYKNDGLILQGVTYKQNQMNQLDSFVSTIYTSNDSVLNDFNISRMESIVNSPEKFVEFISDKTIRSQAAQEVSSFRSSVQEIAKKKRSGVAISTDEYQDLSKKILDFKSKYSGLEVKTPSTVELTDILTGRRMIVDLNDEKAPKVDVSLTGEITSGGRKFTLAKLKYDQDTIKMIDALTGNNQGVTPAWFEGGNPEQVAREIETKLGLSPGYISTTNQKSYLKLTGTSAKDYRLSLGELVPKNEEGISLAKIENLKGVLDGAAEHEITARLLLSGMDLDRLSSQDNFFRLTYNTLKPVIEKMIPNAFERQEFTKALTISFQSPSLLGIMKSLGTEAKKEAMMLYFQSAAANFLKLEKNGNVATKIMSLDSTKYGITKAELLTQVFSGAVQITENMKTKELLKALGLDSVSVFKGLTQIDGGDLKIISNAWKSVNPNSVADDIFENQFLRMNKNMNNYLVNSQLRSDFIKLITGEESLFSYSVTGGKNYQQRLLNYVQDNLKVDLKGIDKEQNAIKKYLKEVLDTATGDAKLKAQADLDSFETYVKNGIGYTQDLKGLRNRIPTAIDMSEITKMREEAQTMVKAMAYHNDEILEEIKKIDDALHFTSVQLAGKSLMSFDSAIQKSELFKTLSKSFTDMVNGESYMYKGFLNQDNKVTNWGDVPHVAISNAAFKWKPMELEGKINKKSLEIFDAEIEKQFPGTNLKTLRDTAKTERHYESMLLDTKFGKEIYMAREGGSIDLDISSIESLLNPYNTVLKTADDVSAMIVTMQKSLMASKGDQYDALKIGELLSQYRESLIKDIERSAGIDQGMKVEPGIVEAFKQFLGVLSKRSAGKDVTNAFGGLITNMFTRVAIDGEKIGINLVYDKNATTKELRNKLSKYIIPQNSIYGMIKNQFNAENKPLLDFIIGDNGIYDNIVNIFGDSISLPDKKIFNIMKAEYLKIKKITEDEIAKGGLAKGVLDELEKEFNIQLENILLDNLPKYYFQAFNMTQFEDMILNAKKDLKDIDNNIVEKVIDKLKTKSSFSKDEKEVLNALVTHIYSFMNSAKSSEIGTKGSELINKIPSPDFNYFISKISVGLQKAYEISKDLRLKQSDLTPIDQEAYEAQKNKSYESIEKLVQASMKAINSVTNDADIIRFGEDTDNQIKIRQKILSSIDNKTSEFFYDGVSLGAGGYKKSTELLEHSFGYNKIFQLSDMLDISLKNISEMNLPYKYKSVKLLSYEGSLVPSVKKRTLWAESSDEDIMVAYQYLNNMKYVDRVLNKKGSGKMNFEMKDVSIFTEREITTEMLQDLDLAFGSNLGNNFIGVPYIGEDATKGFVINPNDAIILQFFKPIDGKRPTMEDRRVIVDKVMNVVMDDVRNIRGLEQFDTSKSLAKRVRQNLAAGNGVLKSNLEVSEILLSTQSYNKLLNIPEFGIEIDKKNTIVTQALTDEEVQALIKMNDGNEIVSADLELKIPEIIDVKPIKDYFSSVIDQSNDRLVRMVIGADVADSMKKNIQEGMNLIDTIDKEINPQKLETLKTELKNRMEEGRKVIASFPDSRKKERDSALNELNKKESEIADIIENRISINQPSSSTGFNISDFTKMDNIVTDIQKSQYKALKAYLADATIPNLKGALERGSDGRFKDKNGTPLENTFKGFMASGNRDSIADKMINLINTDVLDGTGFQSRSMAIKIFEESVGRKYNPETDSESLFDMKAHIAGHGHLTKTKSFTLTESQDQVIRKKLEDTGYIKPGQDYILSPIGGVKSKTEGFRSVKNDKVNVGPYELDILGHRKLSAKDIEYASQHSIDHKDSIKMSVQMMVTMNPTAQDILGNIHTLKLAQIEKTSLESYEADRVLVNNDGTAFGIQTMNDTMTTAQQKVLTMIEGHELNGSNLSIKDSGMVTDKDGKASLAEMGKVYVSPKFYEDHSSEFHKIGNKFYVVTHRNPVPTGYNKGMYEVEINHSNVGYQITGNPMDTLFKKEADHDGDTISLSFRDKDLDGLIAKLHFIDTAEKTDIGYTMERRFGINTEREIKAWINAEYKKVSDLIINKQEANEGIGNYWIATSQIDALPDELRGVVSKFRNSVIDDFTDTVTAKKQIGFVSVAEEFVQTLASDIVHAKYDPEFGKSYIGNLNLQVLSQFIDGISQSGNIAMADLLQMTIDFAKADSKFPKDWMNHMGKVFEFKKGPDGKDLISEEQKAIVFEHIKELGKYIKDFKKYDTTNFVDMDISNLPPSLKKKYGDSQKTMKMLADKKISTEEMKIMQRSILKNHYGIKESTLSGKQQEVGSKENLIAKFLQSGYLAKGDDTFPDQAITLRRALRYEYLDSIVGLSNNLDNKIIKDGTDANHLVSIYDRLTAGMTAEQHKFGFDMMGKEKSMFHMLRTSKGIEITKTSEFDMGAEKKLLNMIADGEAKYWAKTGLSPTKDQKMDASLAYLTTGISSISKLYTEEMAKTMFIFSTIQYGSRASVKRIKELASKYFGGDEDKVNELVRFLNLNDEQSTVMDFMNELIGNNEGAGKLLEQYNFDIIDQGGNKAKLVFTDKNTRQALIDKVLTANDLSDIEYQVWHTKFSNNENTPIVFYFKDGKLSVKDTEPISGTLQFKTEDIYKKYISDNLITSKEYLRNVEAFDSEKMPKLIDDMNESIQYSFEARSLKIFDLLTSYFPEITARILRIRSETKSIDPILRNLRDINNKYKSSDIGARDTEYANGLKYIENAIFKASRGLSVIENVETLIPQTNNETYKIKFKEYARDLAQGVGKDLHKVLASLDYNVSKMPTKSDSSYLFDFLEDAAGGHTAALNEQGITSVDELKKRMDEVRVKKGISKLVYDSNVKNLEQALFNTGNEGYFIKGVKTAKGVASALKYSYLAGMGGFLTTMVQLPADFLMMTSFKSPAFRDPRIEQFAIENKILNSEKINPDNIINDSAPLPMLTAPLHGIFKIVRSYLPGVTLKDWSKYVENSMANTLSINDQVLYSMRRKIAVANAFDTFATRKGITMDEMFAQYNAMSPKAKKVFQDNIAIFTQRNFLSMSGGTSTAQIFQETVFSRGGHNAWNFLAGWGTNMTSLHITGMSNLFKASSSYFSGNTNAAKQQFGDFSDYVGRMLNTTIMASAIIAKYDILFNDNEREDGEYDMLQFAIGINNAISGLRSFALISSIESTIKKTSDNNGIEENAAILAKEILGKFGREFNLPKDIVGFVMLGLKEKQSSEQIMNGTIDLIRNYANTYLTFNRFDTNNAYYKDLYTTNLFATMMGVRDIDSYDEIYDKANNKAQGDLFRFMSPTQTFLSLLTASSYVKLLQNIGGPESFQWEIQKINEMNKIRENDKLLRDAITKGITPEILNSIMTKGNTLDEEATQALFSKLTSYSSIGMGNFLSDGFGDTAYQMKKSGHKGDLSQQLVTSKLEEKYGKQMVDAIVQGDLDYLSKHLETKIGSEMFKNFMNDDPKEANSDKNRKDLLVAFEKSGISIPTMISILTYSYKRDLLYANKGLGESEAQALAINKYYPLINGDVNAITDVTNAYMLKQYPNIAGMFKYEDPKTGEEKGVISQSIKNKLLLDNLVARSYYENGDTTDVVLASRWSSLFNNIYNTMKDQEGGITKANAKEIVVNYLMVDEQLKDLSGKTDPEKIFKFREAVFASMLQKPEVMVELNETLTSLGKEDNFTKVGHSLVKRLFDFDNEAVSKNMPDFTKAVKENYDRTYGKKPSGSGKSYGGFSAPAKKAYEPRKLDYGNAKELTKNAMERGLDMSRPSPNMLTGQSPYPSIGGLGGPSQFYQGMKDFNNIVYAQMQDQLSKDLFRKSPEYIEKIYRVMRARAEGIGLKSNLPLQSFEQLPSVWRKPLSKGLLKGLAYNRPEN